MRLPSESKQQLFLKNLWSENPVMFSGLGIFLAVAGTATIEQAFFLGAIVLLLLLFNSLVSSAVGELFQKKVPLWPQVILTSVVLSALALFLAGAFAALPDNTRILYALLAASPLVYSRAQLLSYNTTIDRALFDAAGTGVGTVFVLVFIALVRQVVGQGSMASFTVFPQAPWPLLSTMFGGILLTGIMMVIFNLIKNKK
ncbi:MAG: Rnf-Nqr domain containing protein [bacterium]|nr:Rnf-Nqr domain containing protein [bacterium]